MIENCAEFILTHPEFGPPIWDREMPRRACSASKAILDPIRKRLLENGETVGRIETGKPWGAGFTIKRERFMVDCFLLPNANVELNRWEGQIWVRSRPRFLQRLLGENENSFDQGVMEIFTIFRKAIEADQGFDGIRYLPLMIACSKADYDSTMPNK